jgi:predicted ferric reductase
MHAVKNENMKSAAIEQTDDGLLTTVLLLTGVLVGAVAAVVVLPVLVPGMGTSATASEPTIYWHLSRASGFTAFGLMWMSMAFGVIITNKMARVWPGGPTAFDLHEYTSLIGLGFGLFHALILLGGQYITYDLVSLLVPFAGADYRPVWVGLGQIGLYGLALVSFTFYVRNRIGQRAWRLIHYGSYAMFVLVLTHSIFSGSDTGAAWSGLIYWFAALSLAVLTVHRVVSRTIKQGRAA